MDIFTKADKNLKTPNRLRKPLDKHIARGDNEAIDLNNLER